MVKDHAKDARKMANRVVPLQYRSRIASIRPHGFHSASFQALFIAAVDRMPKVADSVTAIGLVMSCDHIAPVFDLEYLARSGWLQINVAVFPMRLLAVV
jgi:hypothetical protein